MRVNLYLISSSATGKHRPTNTYALILRKDFALELNLCNIHLCIITHRKFVIHRKDILFAYFKVLWPSA